MTGNERDLEQEVARELHRRAEAATSVSGLAGAAKQRAHTIRRRRYLAAGALTAVALAVAVPTALSIGGTPRTAPLPATTPTTSPTAPTPDATTPAAPTTPPATVPAPPPSSDPSVPPPTSDEPPPPSGVGGTTSLSLDGLSTGPLPSIAYVDGTRFRPPGGNETDLPQGYANPVAYGSAVYAMSWIDDAVAILRPGDDPVTIPGMGPIVSSDGGSIGWYEAAGTLTVFTSPGEGTVPLESDVPAGQRLEPIGFLGPRDVISNVSTDEELWAGARRDTFADGEVQGTSTTPPWDLISMVAVSQSAQLVAGFSSITDSGSCSAVYPADGDTPLWETCDYSFDRFSPDGRYLIGGPAYRDGIGNAFTVVVDAQTGDLVHRFDAELGWITGAAFEDNDHLLINFNVPGGTEIHSALIRCGVDGSCELATEVATTTDEAETSYAFGAQP